MKQTEEKIEDIINYFAISLFGQSTVDEILWDLAKNCISKLDFEDCVIYLLDEERSVLVQRAAYGPKNPKDYTILQPIEIPVGKGIVGSVAQLGIPEVISDTSNDPRYIKDDAFRYSEISVPIILDGRVIGVIDSEHSQPGFFNERHLRILTLIASLCANKLMWARAEEKVRKEQQARFEAQQRLAEFKLHALQAQMNPHFIFNSLNAIQYFITEKETGDALNFLSQFGKLIRKILNCSSRSFIPLVDEVEILKYYLTLEKMRFDSRFEYTITISDTLDPFAVEIPVLLIHPFVEHVLTEGLLSRERVGLLTIRFDRAGEFLRCVIKNKEDSTAGSPSNFPYRKTALNTEAWWEVHERIELINRLYNVNIHVNLIGTRVEVNVPLRTLTA